MDFSANYSAYLGQFTSLYPDDVLRIRHDHGRMEISLNGFAPILTVTKLKKILSLTKESPDQPALVKKMVSWFRSQIAGDFESSKSATETERRKLQRRIQIYQKYETLCLKYA